MVQARGGENVLLVVVAVMAASVLVVGVGDRLTLPWPAPMVVLGVAVAFGTALAWLADRVLRRLDLRGTPLR